MASTIMVPLARRLLHWYDQEGRTLPWRVRAPDKADPYRVWLSEIMCQQTVIKAVLPYYETFLRRWPRVHDLAAAPDDEVMAAWAGLGYYARARKLIACARAVAERGEFPATARELLALPGIGPYTAAAIAAIVHDEAIAVVDGNVERVMTRLFAVRTPLPRAKERVRALLHPLVPEKRAGDFAQAMMDLGALVCTPRTPHCKICPLRTACKAYAQGTPTRFPVKAPRQKREQRAAAVYWITRGNHVLLRRRPAQGLLGGMMEIPSSGWTADFKPAPTHAPLNLRYRQWPGTVAHTFSHFDAAVSIFIAKTRAKTAPPGDDFFWWPLDRLHAAGLPSVMKKVVKAVQSG